MTIKNFDTLSQAMNTLTEQGYKENFKAKEDNIEAIFSKRTYNPKDLQIKDKFRFEGMSNPGDSTELFAIEAFDGTKGTLTMSYNSRENQNQDLIKAIPKTQ